MTNEHTSRSEALSETKGIYGVLSDLVGRHSDLAVDYADGLQRTIANPPAETLSLQEFYRMQDEVYDRREAGALSDEERDSALTALLDRRAVSSAYDWAVDDLQHFEIGGVIEAYITDEQISAINATLCTARNIDSQKKSAPFRDFGQNTDEVWRYVDPDYVSDYLLAKPFVESQTINSIARFADSHTLLRPTTLYGMEPRLFEIPTAFVVRAAGFGSWLGRDGEDGTLGNGEKAIALPDFTRMDSKDVSLNAIKAYAGHNAPLPPVGLMNVYVQPNSVVFADNGSGDSHRIAAAILRGEDSVKAHLVSITLLRENAFE